MITSHNSHVFICLVGLFAYTKPTGWILVKLGRKTVGGDPKTTWPFGANPDYRIQDFLMRMDYALGTG